MIATSKVDIPKGTLPVLSNGFTLLELVIVVLIMWILATLGFVQFGKTIERSRTAEAKGILSSIRTAEHAYKQQYGAYTADINDLPVDNAAPVCVANGNNYYFYNVDAAIATATRCTGGLGKFSQRKHRIYDDN